MITLTVQTRLNKGAIFYYEPAATIFTGTLVPNPEWIADDCITLLVDDPFMPMRIIPCRDIDSQPLPPQASAAASYACIGSKGDLYTVTDDGRFWSCTCRGFEFRKDCRHIREIKNQLQAL